MSLDGLTRTHTIDHDGYDHAIGLVDTTGAESDPPHISEDPANPESSGAPLTRQWTRSRLKEEVAKRKYAKWQEGKQRTSTDTAGPNVEAREESTEGEATERGKGPKVASRLKDKVASRSKRKGAPRQDRPDYEVDILYENQRGSFLCGIPLYSAKSLLNFDPSGWQTSTFHDSPVNITNAQLPDPSWAWAWRTWYVDMSHDVDEEGWEYSFSFQNSFAWHGSHPWFHSFVRRRRWLRKRVKIRSPRTGEKNDKNAAHLLTAEYFTIHPKREPSPDSVGYRTSVGGSTYLSKFANADESDEDTAEITDLVALMAALRRSRVDRERIAAVNNFLEHGGDEIYYLSEKMDSIMGLFIYQTSRRQFQTLLLEALDTAVGDSDGSFDGATESDGRGQSRSGNLLKAVRAANVHINDQDFWSEVRAKADAENPPRASVEGETLGATESSGEPGKGPEIEEKPRTSVQDDIKGIPDEAHVSAEPGISWNKASRSPMKETKEE